MTIAYSWDKEHITKEGLEELFLSVEWESGKFPDSLFLAIKGSHSVLTAWDGHKLIGLANALSDGVLTAYFHYVLIDPAYQGKGIGQEIMERMLKNYEGYQTKVLIAYPDVTEFYEKLGFERRDENMPMYISNLI